MREQYIGCINGYVSSVISTLRSLPVADIARVAEVIEGARAEGRRVFIFGNGGSAATATHFACDLSKGAICEDKPRIRAISLCDNLSLLSAWANDTHYSNIFAEQVENLVEPGDVVIGISGSGNSPNVLNGVLAAADRGAVTIGFSGFDGGRLRDIVDIPVVVENDCMEQVEDIHLLLEHVITTCLKLSSPLFEEELVAIVEQGMSSHSEDG